MQNTTHQRWIGAVTVAAGVTALASLLTVLLAVTYHSEALADPMLVLDLPAVNANLIKGSMLLDMLGYYLLLLPLVLLLRDRFREDALLSKLGGACGTAYVLAAVWPYVISAYKTAGADEQKALAAAFRFFDLMVYEGMWNLLETVFAAAWWVITGLLLFRRGFSLLGSFTLVLGGSCLADALSGMFGWAGLHRVSLNTCLLLSIAWMITIGLLLLRKPFPDHLLAGRPFNRHAGNRRTAAMQSWKKDAASAVSP